MKEMLEKRHVARGDALSESYEEVGRRRRKQGRQYTFGPEVLRQISSLGDCANELARRLRVCFEPLR